MEKNSEKIAKLNDAFRQELDNPFVAVNPKNQVITTQGIWDIYNNDEISSIFQDIKKYDNDMKYHSPDNTNPEVTKRVLTVMLANEY